MRSVLGLYKVALPVNGLLARTQSTAAALPLHYEEAKTFEEIPSPRGLPFFKNFLDFVKTENQKNFTTYHKKLIAELGTIYKLRMPMGQDLVFITKPDDVRTLHSLDGPYPLSMGFETLERVRKGALSDKYKTAGMASQGKEWHEFRQLVQQDMMRPKSAMFYIDDISDVVDELLERMVKNMNNQQEVKNISKVLQEFALEAVAIMFIGRKLGTLQGADEAQKLIKAVQRTFELVVVMLVFPEPFAKLFPQYWEFVKCNAIMFDVCKANIDKAIAKDKIDGSLKGTVLKKFIDRCGEDSPIPVVMAADALAAGIDTTGNSAAFLMYHLATNPDKQEKLYKEIVDVLGKDGKLTESKLTEMRFLKACQTESLRLSSIVIATARRTQVDMVLDGYQIPAGTNVMRHATFANVDEKFFPHPEKFQPERWIRGSQEYGVKNPYANLPFGHGPRACLGQRFARLEMYVLACRMIQKFKISYDGPPIGMDQRGVGSPDRELKLKMVRR